MAGWEYFDALVHLAQAGARLSKSEVAYGMRYVVASLWALADNARPMAVEKLRLAGQSTSAPTSVCFFLLLHHCPPSYVCHQAPPLPPPLLPVCLHARLQHCLPTCQTDLCCYYMRLDLEGIQAGVVLSTNFKTAATYRHQPVTVPLLLDVYVKYFRQGSPEVEEVFLTNKGTPMKQGYINRAFADYFAIFDLKVSITDVRKMLESAFFEAMQLNTITYEQYCQVSIYI